MELNLIEWNNILKYADQLVNRLRNEYNLKAKFAVYRMYNGTRGINFFVLDDLENVFCSYNSGVLDDRATEYKTILNNCYFDILRAVGIR